MDSYGVAQLLQPGRGFDGRQPAWNEIDQQRRLHLAGDALDLVDALRRLDKDNVRAGPRVPVAPFDGFVESQRGSRVGAGNDEKVVVGAGVEGGGEFLLKDRGID